MELVESSSGVVEIEAVESSLEVAEVRPVELLLKVAIVEVIESSPKVAEVELVGSSTCVPEAEVVESAAGLRCSPRPLKRLIDVPLNVPGVEVVDSSPSVDAGGLKSVVVANEAATSSRDPAQRASSFMSACSTS